MAVYSGGQEFSLEDKVTWNTIVVGVGQVVEVDVERSDIQVQVEAWAAFVVVNVTTRDDGSLALDVRFLGCESQEVTDLLDRDVNMRENAPQIHLCVEAPCNDILDTELLIHAKRIRIWNYSEFVDRPYLTDEMHRQVKGWLGKPRLPKPAVRAPRKHGGGRKSALKPADARGAGLRGTPKASSGRKVAMKHRLRSRLAEIKRNVGSAHHGEEAVEINTDDDEDLELGGEPVGTGNAPGGVIVPSLPKGVSQLLKEASKKDSTKTRKVMALEPERSKKEHGVEDTNITTSKSSRNQLL